MNLKIYPNYQGVLRSQNQQQFSMFPLFTAFRPRSGPHVVHLSNVAAHSLLVVLCFYTSHLTSPRRGCRTATDRTNYCRAILRTHSNFSVQGNRSA